MVVELEQQFRASVLVVDDDEAIRVLLVRVLQRAGFRVTPAIDGLGAIEMLSQNRYDAVVLDLMMPRGNGFDVIAYVKTHDPGHKCVIVLSAAADRVIEATDSEVVAAKLRKPFDLQELMSAIDHCVPGETT